MSGRTSPDGESSAPGGSLVQNRGAPRDCGSPIPGPTRAPGGESSAAHSFALPSSSVGGFLKEPLRQRNASAVVHPFLTESACRSPTWSGRDLAPKVARVQPCRHPPGEVFEEVVLPCSTQPPPRRPLRRTEVWPRPCKSRVRRPSAAARERRRRLLLNALRVVGDLVSIVFPADLNCFRALAQASCCGRAEHAFRVALVMRPVRRRSCGPISHLPLRVIPAACDAAFTRASVWLPPEAVHADAARSPR